MTTLVSVGQITIVDVNDGLPGSAVTINSTAQGFTFVDGVASPASQSIGFMVVRQNVEGGVAWEANGGAVPLTVDTNQVSVPGMTTGTYVAGTGDMAYLSLADFGAADQVVVTARVGEYSASVTIVRLDRSTADAGANQTSIDASGNIQGVSAGAGQSVANNQDSVIRAPGGGVFVGTTPNFTGSLKIRLPQTWTSTMLKFAVDIFEYSTGYCCTIEIGGYNFSSASSYWANVTARVIGGSNTEYPVYFGHDGVKCCVWIGTSAETWSYPQVRIKDVFAGFTNYTKDRWEAGWQISFDAGPLAQVAYPSADHQYNTSVLDTLPGADWAKTSKRPANLSALTGSEGINNANVTLSSTGVLGGAGGGQIRTIGVFDTARATDSPPNAYPVGTTKEFKRRSAFVGLGGADAYFTLETIIQYPDATGGAAYQYAYVGATTWRRVGACSAASWSGSWVQDLDRAAYTGALDATRNVNRGVWASGVLYSVGDMVQNLGSSWSCTTTHTSSGSLVLPILPATSNANWNLLSAAGANGATGYTLNFTNAAASLTQVGTVTKTAATNAYDAQAYSTEGYTRGCYVSAKALFANSKVLIGLNSDPTADANYTSLDYAWYWDTSGALYIYESSVSQGTFGTYTTSTVLSISYDGQNIRYMKDGAVVRTIARSVGAALFFDSTINSQNDGFTALQFGPMGEAGVRGSVKRYATGGAWSDAVALTAVGGSAVAGDEVTITDGSTFVMTKYYTAGAWTVPGTVIDGNLLVTGSIKGASLDVQALRGKTLNAGIYMDAGTTTTAAKTVPGAGTTSTVDVVSTEDFPSIGCALLLSTSSALMGWFRYSGKTQTSLLSADWTGFDIPANAIIAPMPTSGGLVWTGAAGATTIQVGSEYTHFRRAGGNALILPTFNSSMTGLNVFSYTGADMTSNVVKTLTGVSGITQSIDTKECVAIDLTPNIPSAILSAGAQSTITIATGTLESFSAAGGMLYLVGPDSVQMNIKGYLTAVGSTVTLTAPVTITTAGTYYLIPSFTNTIVGSAVASVVAVAEATGAAVVSAVVSDSRGQSRFGSNSNPPPSSNAYAAPLKVNVHNGVAIHSVSTSDQLGPLVHLQGGGVKLDSVWPSQGATTYSATRIGSRHFAAYIEGGGGSYTYPLQDSMMSKNVAWIMPNNATAYEAFGFAPTFTNGTTFAVKNATTDYNKRNRIVCSGATAYASGFYIPSAGYFQGDPASSTGGFFAAFSYKPTDTNGTPRMFAGMRTAVTVIPNGTNPATLVNSFGVGVIAADLTQLYVLSGGSVAQAPVPTGVAPNGVYRVAIYSRRGDNIVNITIEDISVPGAYAMLYEGILYNDGAGVTMPLPGTALAPTLWRSSASGATSTDLLNFYIETDV